MSASFRVHSGLDREAPGSVDSTRRALAMVTDLPPAPLVVDAGCGPGASAVDLALALPGARVVAVDLHAPFVAAVAERAVAAGVGDRVVGVAGDMADLGGVLATAGVGGPVDLIWSEGAAYVIGFEAALAAWRSLLVAGGAGGRGGAIALTDAVWTSPTVPQAVRDYWEAGYPDIQPAQVRRAQIAPAGFHRVGDFPLPRGDWEAYYEPIRSRVEALRPEAADDPELAGALAATEEELAIFDGGGAEAVGYQFFVMRRRD